MKFPILLISATQLTSALPGGEVIRRLEDRAAPLMISTTSGHVHGKIEEWVPKVRQFLGIPYAVPPLGDLRFALPQKLYQPNTQIEATKIPPSCVQFQGSSKNHFGNQEVLQFFPAGKNHTGPWTEDCLTLSIWAPVKTPTSAYDRKNGVPVVIFSYGGGYQLGGENVPYQIPAQWVNRSPNHIVLSFNYVRNLGLYTIQSLTNMGYMLTKI